MSQKPQLTRVQVAMARDLLRRGYSPKRVIAKLQLTLSPKQLPDALVKPRQHQFTADDFARIDALRAKGVSWMKIGALFGVKPQTLRDHCEVARGEHEKIAARLAKVRRKRAAIAQRRKLEREAAANQRDGG